MRATPCHMPHQFHFLITLDSVHPALCWMLMKVTSWWWWTHWRRSQSPGWSLILAPSMMRVEWSPGHPWPPVSWLEAHIPAGGQYFARKKLMWIEWVELNIFMGQKAVLRLATYVSSVSSSSSGPAWLALVFRSWSLTRAGSLCDLLGLASLSSWTGVMSEALFIHTLYIVVTHLSSPGPFARPRVLSRKLCVIRRVRAKLITRIILINLTKLFTSGRQILTLADVTSHCNDKWDHHCSGYVWSHQPGICWMPHLLTSLSSSSVTSAPGLGSLSSLSMLIGMEILGLVTLGPPLLLLSEEDTESGSKCLMFVVQTHILFF